MIDVGVWVSFSLCFLFYSLRFHRLLYVCDRRGGLGEFFFMLEIGVGVWVSFFFNFLFYCIILVINMI